MKTIPISSGKLAFTFKAENKPAIDPADPQFEVLLGNPPVLIRGKLNAKAARKLQAHDFGCKIEGRLVVEAGRLVLDSVGVQLFDPPKPSIEPSPVFASPPVASPALSKLAQLVASREKKP